MKARHHAWDFGYERPHAQQVAEPNAPADLIVAAHDAAGLRALRAALRGLEDGLEVTSLLERAPIFWARVRGPGPLPAKEFAGRLSAAGVPYRYVTSAFAPSMALPPPLDFASAPPVRSTSWRVRNARSLPSSASSHGDWFLGGGGGVNVDRPVCGTGSRTRLAVIDDEVADLDRVELESIVCVGVEAAPATSGHTALMVGWATSARRDTGDRFVGVAPDASTRVYCIPKPGVDVCSLPVAIASAVFAGADVVVCATYLCGNATSPLLDDALEVAVHLGRRGRGTLVVLPTGREASSAGGSLHASLSLGLEDPASDARVHCVAPGGREGGWFLWKGAAGRLRPFSNRGPAVRWLAPGDDVAYPFGSRDRLFHAESSGAAAIAAGVALLVLASNPKLRLPELHALLARTVERPESPLDGLPIADPADLLPLGHDRDGHNAKTGYGRLDASAACVSAQDPIALALAAIGETDAARSWCARPVQPYSRRTARWTVRALLARPDVEHAVRALARHVRLIAAKPSRGRSHTPAALARQAAIISRELGRMRPPPLVARELDQLCKALVAQAEHGTAALDQAALAVFPDWSKDPAPTYGPVSVADARS